MQNVKLSKRQIKEDKFTAFMLRAKSQFVDNWQFYLVGIVVVVIIIAGSIYLADYQGRRAVEAQAKFSQAMTSYQSGQTQVAIVELNSVLEEYGGEDAAEQATFLLGRVNLDTRNYAEAISNFETYTQKYKSNKRDLAAAYAGIGTAYENQGNYEDAQKNFQMAVDAYPDGPLAGDYLLALLRIDLKSQDTASAEAHLKKINEDFPNSEITNKAIMMAGEEGVFLPPTE